MNKTEFLGLIRSNINKHGYHITIVSGDTEPRYAYTIGLKDELGFELVMAGGVYFMKDELLEIVELIVQQLKKGLGPYGISIHTNKFGQFNLADVHQSWMNLLLLGVFDYYQVKEFTAFQIIPDKIHYTYDIPDMSKVRGTESEPVWKLLTEKWDLSVSKTSQVVTNLKALQGYKVTEVSRWEENEWEMFVGSSSKVQKDEVRVVSIGTLVAVDNTLLEALKLSAGKGIYRNTSDLIWKDWR